jgi:ankyrin repeat protein
VAAVILLLDPGANVNSIGGYYGTALQAASWAGSKEVIRQLHAMGADINLQGGHYGNAVQDASCIGNKEVVTQKQD